MQKQQRVRRAWLAHGQADDREELLAPVKSTCTCTPLSAPTSRPVTSVSQPRPSLDSATRSFWAQELPVLAGGGRGVALQRLSADAHQLALVALSLRDARKLDELAIILAEILEIINEKSHPTLTFAIKQAGLQTPDQSSLTADRDLSLLAAPTNHDLVTLLAALSAQVTYGMALPPVPAEAKPSKWKTVTKAAGVEDEEEDLDAKDVLVNATHFRREVAELRRKLALRVEEFGDEAAVSPRFSQAAQAIIRREEQLQRQRQVLRSQRAATQASLHQVRKQMKKTKGTKTEVSRVLRRMEHEHLEAAQKWEYRRECLQQERMRLMELAMAAFCKVVYEDRGLNNNRSLVHGRSPLGDPQILWSTLDRPVSQPQPLS